ncbi:MAG: hypothetical protein D6784_03810 [Chloroflexi bacterium]|nr:MAG: hypothetical protein D6784_03810 [Chloroflexota bacterium]
MPSSTDQPPAWPADKLEYAIELARKGQHIAARDILRRVVALQPVNQEAWLWLVALAESREEALQALEKAKSINPDHPRLPQVEQWLARRFPRKAVPRKQPSTDTGKPSPPAQPVLSILAASRTTVGLVLAGLAVAVAILFWGVLAQFQAVAKTAPPDKSQTLQAYLPELEAARTRHDWPRLISLLETLYQQNPDNPALTQQLADAYLQQGISLRNRGFIEEARPLFEKTLSLNPTYTRAGQEYQLASAYLQGRDYYQAGRWPEAIEQFESILRRDQTYPHLIDLLYSAYYNHGLSAEASGNLKEAQQAIEAAIALRPDLPAARQQLAAISYALAPDTPPETPLPSPSAQDQLIVVGIAEQRMLVFEKGKQVFDFVVSTGEPGRDTAIGDFEILNKIDVAYASTWNLDMPYWMGIYWSGPLQNGIHALPIVKHTGYKLWDGYLGQRVSYGCIILSDEDAKTLYEWTRIGAKVKIVPSLTRWLAENPHLVPSQF